MTRRTRRVLTATGIFAALLCGVGTFMFLRTKAAFEQIDIVDPGPEGLRVAQDGVFANYFPAQGSGPHPGVVLLGGSEGGLSQGVRQAAVALQNEGYSVLTPSYFGGPDQPRHLEGVPLETFDRALAWLAARPEVDAGRIVLGGVSKGAEAALLVATRHPELRGVVAGVPSSVVWPGIRFTTLNTESSWTLEDRPLPFLPYGPLRLRMLTGDIGVVYRDGMNKVEGHPEAAIPVEELRMPVLLVCGEQDKLWPSCPMSRQLQARAARLGGPMVRVLSYPDAGHGSVGPPLAADDPDRSRLGAMGGTAQANNEARSDGWPKIIDFIRAAVAD
jgi:uncharacterized protein